MADALARKFDCVAVWKLDRFGRSVVNFSNAIQKLDVAGVRFVSITQGIDTDKSNPMSQLLMNILVAFAEFERELIRERVAAGMKRARESGTKSGNPIGRPQKIVNRQAVWDARDAGKSITQLQKLFDLSRGAVQRTLKARHTVC